MKYLIIAALLCVSIPLFSQNKHINFDNAGKIETNPYTKVDTIILINKNQGIITDTVFTVSLNDMPVFYVSKKNPQATHSFFPFRSLQIVKKKDEGEMKPASLFVFDIIGFFCFALVFFCLIISLGMINRKYLKSVRSAFSEVNASFIATKTQLAALEHRVSKIKDHSHEISSIISKISFFEKELNNFLNEEREIVVEMNNLNERIQKKIIKLNHDRVSDYTGLTEEEITLMDKKLVDYHFSSRALKTFETSDIFTFSDLLRYVVGSSMRDIMRFRNIGKKSMREIVGILREHDLIDYVPENAKADFVLTSKYSSYLDLTK